MGGCHNAQIDGDRSIGSHGSDLELLENPQQGRLPLGAELGDFIQE